MTAGIATIQEHDPELFRSILAAIQSQQEFDPDNDPYGEHDFGSVTVQGEKIFWKISYFDLNCEFHSDDPANPDVTQRVMYIMLADEY